MRTTLRSNIGVGRESILPKTTATKTNGSAVHKSVKNGQLKKRTSYGRIDIYLKLPWEEFFMPRSYRNISMYEKEILELKQMEKL